MLGRLPLAVVELEALAKHGLGGFVLAGGLEHARGLDQSGGLVADGRAADRRERAQHGRPLLHGRSNGALPFVHPPEVDVGGHEVGIEGDGPLELLARGVQLAGVGQRDGVVEQDRIE